MGHFQATAGPTGRSRKHGRGILVKGGRGRSHGVDRRQLIVALATGRMVIVGILHGEESGGTATAWGKGKSKAAEKGGSEKRITE